MQNKRQRNMIIAGRRWRKTTLAMMQAVIAAAKGMTVLWTAPIAKQVMIGWWETQKAVRGLARFHKNDMLADFPGGGKILYRSLDDPTHARGYSPQLIIIDEAGDVSSEAYYETILPMLFDSRAELWIIGTPRGKNWLYFEAQAFQHKPDLCAYFNAPAVGCYRDEETNQLVRKPHPLENPYIPFEAIVAYYESVPWKEFRQEALAEFVEQGGAVFNNVYDVVMIGEPGPIPPNNFPPGTRFIAGVDLGRFTDYTVISIFTEQGKQVALYRFTGLSWEVQIKHIINIIREYQCDVVIDRTNHGEPVLERIQQEVADTRLPVVVESLYLDPTTKKSLIDGLVLAIEKQSIQLLDDKNQYNELTAYEYTETPSGLLRTSAPKGMHDDIVIADALAVSRLAISQAAGVYSPERWRYADFKVTPEDYFSYDR